MGCSRIYVRAMTIESSANHWRTLTKVLRIIFWLGLMLSLGLGLAQFLLLGAPPPGVINNAPSQQHQGVPPKAPVVAADGSVTTIALVTSVLALFTSVITNLIAVRKEKRESDKERREAAIAAQQAEKLQLEIEKLKRDLEPRP